MASSHVAHKAPGANTGCNPCMCKVPFSCGTAAAQLFAATIASWLAFSLFFGNF